MRPQNRTARDRLAAELRHNSPVAARELADRLLISVPTALRILKERGASVVRIGATKNARYASRRLLRGSAHPIPVYRVDNQGRGHDVGSLDLLEPNGSVFGTVQKRARFKNGVFWAPVDEQIPTGNQCS